jgi:hypothetical protein
MKDLRSNATGNARDDELVIEKHGLVAQAARRRLRAHRINKVFRARRR